MTPRASHTTRGARVVRLALLVGVVVALLAGCETTAVVRVDVKPNGSGTVTVDVSLDAEAAAKVGDLSKVVQFDDLRKAGWKITGPTVSKDRAKGMVHVVASRPFDDVGQANEILASISGPDGPLKGVRLTRTSSFTSTTVSMVGTVDLTKGLDAFGDSDLTTALGTSVADAATRFNGGKPVADGLSVTLQADAEGGLRWSGPRGRASGSANQLDVTTSPGAKPVRIEVHASQTHWTAILLAALAVLAVLGALVLTLLPLLPGRGAPPPPKRKRQHHSATDAWTYVAGREGRSALDPKAARQAHRGRRGRHRRPRGETPRWMADEITVDPDEQVIVRREQPGGTDDRGPGSGPSDPSGPSDLPEHR